MKKQIETLTEQESAFAAENHSLIFRFYAGRGCPRTNTTMSLCSAS